MISYCTLILLCALVTPVTSQLDTLMASPTSAHPGQQVNFTCVDRSTDTVSFRTFSKDSGLAQCELNITRPCSPTYPSGAACGCVDSSPGVKTHMFTRTVSLGDTGSWTCEIRVAPGNVIRSGGVTLNVTVATTTQTPGGSTLSTTASSSVFLVKDVCPRNLTQGQHLYISYRQQQDFPPTGGVAINIVHNGNNENPFRVFNWKECPKENSDYGCSNTSGPMNFYINVTADCSQTGTWTATYDRTPSDHIRSEICQVEGCAGGGADIGAIVGGVFGGLAGVALIGGIAYFVYTKSKKS